MEFLKRLFSMSTNGKSMELASWAEVPAHQASELIVYSEEVNRLSVEFDIEALIVSHERWLPWLLQAVYGDIDAQLRPSAIRDERSSELGAWLHDVGRRALGHQPAYDMLLVRNHYFHLKAAELVTFAESGDSLRADQVFKQCQHASRQMVLLLKELKRGLIHGTSHRISRPTLQHGQR